HRPGAVDQPRERGAPLSASRGGRALWRRDRRTRCRLAGACQRVFGAARARRRRPRLAAIDAGVSVTHGQGQVTAARKELNMTRTLSVAIVVVMAGCAASPPTGGSGGTGGTGGAAGTGGKKRTIIMYKNDNHLSGATPPATAACLGAVTPYRGAKIQRNE